MAKKLLILFLAAMLTGTLASCNKHGCPALEQVENGKKKKKAKPGKAQSGLFPKGF